MDRTLKQIKKCAKALYITGGLDHMFFYLDALADGGWITAEEVDKVANEITASCAAITYKELEEIRAKL